MVSQQGLASLVAADVFDPALAYAGKTLRVAGQVRIENGQPLIEVVVAEQLTVAADATAETKKAEKPQADSTALLDGAWRMVVPEGNPNIKLVTGGRFIWFVAEKGRIVRSATGRCDLQGDRYTESIEAAGLVSDASMAGGTGRFRARLVGDKWFHEGTVTIGGRDAVIKEVWQKIGEKIGDGSEFRGNIGDESESEIRER